LSPLATRVVPTSPSKFMRGVGLIEVAAGALVLNRKTTRFGAYLVGGWLGAIAVNLFTKRKYFDVAVRDIVMGIGAITLAKLTESRERDAVTTEEGDRLERAAERNPRRAATGLQRNAHAFVFGRH